MAITSLDHLPAHLCIHRQDFERVTVHFPMGISPHYLSLMKNVDDPIAKQMIPDVRELDDTQTDADPLNEESQAPVPQIIHRYPHRVIFLVSNQCAVHCRFCMRKRRFAETAQVTPDAIHEGMDYIRQHSEINEVILSGGDPFMLADTALIEILTALRNLPNIGILRIHTRIPNTWPQRITDSTATALSRFHPLYINIHFNHPDEISPQAEQACAVLADAGIPLGSQTVLLQGVNDDVATLHRLFQKLLEIRVRPYYLHQLDRVPGTAHFRVSIDRALDLMNALRGTLSGQAIPHFMVDLPGGGGKVELTPDSIVAKNEHQWVFQNFERRRFNYPLI
jgi:lysine 2,3-aminomutase